MQNELLDASAQELRVPEPEMDMPKMVEEYRPSNKDALREYELNIIS